VSRRLIVATCVVASLFAIPASAQHEYRNLEAGRPTRISDAVPTERYALDLDLTTLRLERLSLGRYRLQYEPRIAFGILPRTEVSMRISSFYRERSISPRGGIAGVGIGGEYQLAMEGLHMPALAIAAEAFVPTGPNAIRTSYSVKGLATRSFSPGRLHLNASYGTFAVRRVTSGGVLVPPVIDGPCDFMIPQTGLAIRAFCSGGLATETSALETTIETKGRWVAGAGLDKSFGVSSVLVVADVFAEKYQGVGRPTDWTAEGGIRKQLTQSLVADIGLGRRFTGISPSWFATAGTTITMPFGR
jgi:hypothetical protein